MVTSCAPQRLILTILPLININTSVFILVLPVTSIRIGLGAGLAVVEAQDGLEGPLWILTNC